MIGANRLENWQDNLIGEAATVAFGEHLGTALASQGGDALIFLHGELGAGKTTLVRGLLRAMGHSAAVKSPTYTLLEPYNLPEQDVYHFDLYRINDPDELALVGFDEIIDGPGLKLVEWPERAAQWLPDPDVEVYLVVIPENQETGTPEGRQVEVRFSASFNPVS